MSTISGKSTLVVIFLCSRDECSNLKKKQDAYGINERPKNLSPFQVERGDNRQLLHGQLLGALLVRVALVAPGFHRRNSVYKGLHTNTLAALEPGVDVLKYQPDLGH